MADTKAETKPAIIGGFVLFGLALGVGAILWFGGHHLGSHSERVVVLFPGSVAGLTKGAPVTFRGVQVGTVESISVRLDARNFTALIPVYLDLLPDSVTVANGASPKGDEAIRRLLAAGLKAQLNVSSFVTGQLEIELDLRPDIRVAPTGGDLGVPEIPAMPSQLEALQDELQGLELRKLVDTSQRTLVSIQRVSDQLGDRIGPMIDNIQKTSDAARETLQTTTAAVKQIQANTGRTIVDFDHAAVEAGHTIHEADKLIVSLNDMTAPGSQSRGDLQAAIRDLAATASSLRNFSHEIERNPATVLTGRGR